MSLSPVSGGDSISTLRLGDPLTAGSTQEGESGELIEFSSVFLLESFLKGLIVVGQRERGLARCCIVVTKKRWIDALAKDFCGDERRVLAIFCWLETRRVITCDDVIYMIRISCRFLLVDLTA